MSDRKVTANDLYLYAVNTGVWYGRHLELARRKSLFGFHVNSVVVPQYIREFPDAKISMKVARDAAEMLEEYYTRHVQEVDDK